tara:strand:+ start:209 stop:889 length:681 start_codon:yes stop_codon:yes gene_type:complete
MSIAIILARGGSKGIPRKNTIDLDGKPLILWSIEQALSSKVISVVYVSSDDDEILKLSENSGAVPIKRGAALSTDTATSEAGWLDVLGQTEPEQSENAVFFALQATSPIREPSDFDLAYKQFCESELDSLFSAEVIRDHYIWKKTNHVLYPDNFRYENRGMRQDMQPKYLENGSFYILNLKKFKIEKKRHFGKVGVYEMQKYKSIQIDQPDDVKIAKALMRYWQYE